VEKKSVEREHWVPCASVAGKMATVVKQLECAVNNLIEGEVYMFRVLAANLMGDGPPLEAFAPVAAMPANPVPDQPSTPKVVEMDKKWVKIEWFVPSSDAADKVKYYIVEKQEEFLVPKVADDDDDQTAAAVENGGGEATDGEGEAAAAQEWDSPKLLNFVA
jgi:hypothetical protein